MSGVYEAYLIRMLAPLGLYDLNGVQNRSELSALGGKLDEVGALLDTVERESLLATAEGEGLDRAGKRSLPENRQLSLRKSGGRPLRRCCGLGRTA